MLTGARDMVSWAGTHRLRWGSFTVYLVSLRDNGNTFDQKSVPD